jgi:DNA-3-methyladenine glycosylase
MLNIVTGEENSAEAVLIRGVEGYNGPGKLTKALRIDRNLNGIDLTSSDELWLEDDGARFDYKVAPRVGIGYAEKEDRERLWRWIAKR